jgi:hypothetical protein
MPEEGSPPNSRTAIEATEAERYRKIRWRMGAEIARSVELALPGACGMITSAGLRNDRCRSSTGAEPEFGRCRHTGWSVTDRRFLVQSMFYKEKC